MHATFPRLAQWRSVHSRSESRATLLQSNFILLPGRCRGRFEFEMASFDLQKSLYTFLSSASALGVWMTFRHVWSKSSVFPPLILRLGLRVLCAGARMTQ